MFRTNCGLKNGFIGKSEIFLGRRRQELCLKKAVRFLDEVMKVENYNG